MSSPSRWPRKASQSSVSKDGQVPTQGNKEARLVGWGRGTGGLEGGGSRAELQSGRGSCTEATAVYSTWRKPTVVRRFLGHGGRLNKYIKYSLPTETSPKLQEGVKGGEH